jgi:hypothetical protein
MTKKIFKKSIAIELMCNGFEFTHTEPNYKKNWLTVFCFEESTELLNKLTEINDREKNK